MKNNFVILENRVSGDRVEAYRMTPDSLADKDSWPQWLVQANMNQNAPIKLVVDPNKNWVKLVGPDSEMAVGIDEYIVCGKKGIVGVFDDNGLSVAYKVIGEEKRGAEQPSESILPDLSGIFMYELGQLVQHKLFSLGGGRSMRMNNFMIISRAKEEHINGTTEKTYTVRGEDGGLSKFTEQELTGVDQNKPGHGEMPMKAGASSSN